MTIDHGWIHFNQHCTLLIILANVQSQSWSLKNKLSNAGCTQGAWMGSQLHNNFQASQAVYGADDVWATPIFLEPGQFNEDLWSPSYYSKLECPILLYNFGSKVCMDFYTNQPQKVHRLDGVV